MSKLFKKIPGLNWSIIATGVSFGILGVMLVEFGNPKNTGVCVSCFLESIAGSMGMHHNVRMMYLRPEIMGFVIGAFVLAKINGDFRPTASPAPMLNFVLGFFTIVGSAMFIGCPIKLLFRFSAGDLTAVAPIFGLVFGVWVGITYMRKGFYLGDVAPSSPIGGIVVTILALLLVVFLLYKPSFIIFSERGPGAVYAPWYISLGVGLFIGVLAQRSRFCIVGSLRNMFLAGDASLLVGLTLMILFAFIAALVTGQFHLGMYDQPGSHLAHGWSFLGMFLTGLASVQLGGCPFRQLVLSGEGNVDAGVSVLGMLAAGALVHNWAIASSSAGPTPNGKIAVLVGMAFCIGVGLLNRD